MSGCQLSHHPVLFVFHPCCGGRECNIPYVKDLRAWLQPAQLSLDPGKISGLVVWGWMMRDELWPSLDSHFCNPTHWSSEDLSGSNPYHNLRGWIEGSYLTTFLGNFRGLLVGLWGGRQCQGQKFTFIIFFLCFFQVQVNDVSKWGVRVEDGLQHRLVIRSPHDARLQGLQR